MNTDKLVRIMLIVFMLVWTYVMLLPVLQSANNRRITGLETNQKSLVQQMSNALAGLDKRVEQLETKRR